MAFVALLPCRDEADIIGQCIQHALAWADAIWVFDTGSTDDSWEIVQDWAERDNRVKPVRKQPVFFSETRLRAFLFDCARRTMRDGDWFVRLDADEFHHVPPPQFVQERLRKIETIVYHQYYDFRLLITEADGWCQERETVDDRLRPIEDRRRHYIPSIYSEPRLCRYRATMRWPDGVSFPYNAGYLAQERLPIRHYPYRDPLQLERRCQLRRTMMADPDNRKHWTQPELHHWAQTQWRTFVTPDDHPDLMYWRPGEALPEFHWRNHLRGPHVRLAQRLVHSFLLRLLDQTRADFPGEQVLQLIPADIQQRLKSEMMPR